MPTLPFCVDNSTWRPQASSKPFVRNAYWRKGHLTLSYAFSKSTLKTTPSSFFVWISWSVSWRTTTPSRMFLFGMKAVWVGATSWACVGFPRRGEGDAAKCSVSISLSFENQGINPVGGSSKVPRTYTNKLRTRNQHNKGVVNPHGHLRKWDLIEIVW